MLFLQYNPATWEQDTPNRTISGMTIPRTFFLCKERKVESTLHPLGELSPPCGPSGKKPSPAAAAAAAAAAADPDYNSL